MTLTGSGPSNPIIRKLELPFIDIQRKYGVKRMGLFGSYARGEEHPDSDIDILVEFTPGNATFDNFMQLAAELEEIFHKHVDLLTCDGLSRYMKPYVEKEVIWIER
jgi:predicted nucleotidyltransferase